MRNFGFPLYWLGYLAIAGSAVLAPLPGRLPDAIARATLVMVVAVLATWVIERRASKGGVPGAATAGLKAIALVVTTLFFMATCTSVRFEPSGLDTLPVYWELVGIVSVLMLSAVLEFTVGRLLRRPFGVTGWIRRNVISRDAQTSRKPM